MELITYDFVEEFVLNYLGNLFKSKCKNDEIYTNHSLENLDYFRTIKKENLTIKEEDRFIQLTISLNMDIPKIQIIINKDNNRLCRVYVNNDVIGCEIGGSLKNVIALAAGVAGGLHTHSAAAEFVDHIALQDALFDEHIPAGGSAFVVKINGTPGVRDGAVIHRRHLLIGHLLS